MIPKPPRIHDDPAPLWARPDSYHCPVCGMNDGCMHPRPEQPSPPAVAGVFDDTIRMKLDDEVTFLKHELGNFNKDYEKLEAGLVELYGPRPWKEGETFVACALRKLKEEKEARATLLAEVHGYDVSRRLEQAQPEVRVGQVWRGERSDPYPHKVWWKVVAVYADAIRLVDKHGGSLRVLARKQLADAGLVLVDEAPAAMIYNCNTSRPGYDGDCGAAIVCKASTGPGCEGCTRQRA